MKRGLFVFLSFIICISTSAQKGNPVQKQAIRKLYWLTGNWVGTSTVERDGKKGITNIRESVQPASDGTLLLINVWATDKDTSTRRQLIAYTSFSVISYDSKNKKYQWTTWRNSGNNYDQYPFTVEQNAFEYTSEENKKQVRYKGNLGSKGEFLETGEFSVGSNLWRQFITMKLVKSK